jgi:PDZ domain-containing secreted protein
MKKIIVLLAICLLTISSSFAQSVPGLKKEISQKVNVDLSSIHLNEKEDDFVKVKFKIYDGIIKVLNIEASQTILKDLIISKLNEIEITTPSNEIEVHNFHFTFKLI